MSVVNKYEFEYTVKTGFTLEVTPRKSGVESGWDLALSKYLPSDLPEFPRLPKVIPMLPRFPELSCTSEVSGRVPMLPKFPKEFPRFRGF